MVDTSDGVIVCGKIYGGKYIKSAKNSPTFLKMGVAPYTIVIWGDVRKTLSYKPEIKLDGKFVCITGKIVEFKGKSQIVIYSEAQIKI
jgi:DNA/RNA endonuclease YhcR with UshA esterase domain